jgi:hypothetical protein
VKNPYIKGEVRAYHIHHNVRHGDLVNRDCTRCHDGDEQESTAFTLSPYRPGNVEPSIAATSTDIVLDGELLIDKNGALQFVPEHDVAQSYKTLINRKNTE